jgi:hypothetical protein
LKHGLSRLKIIVSYFEPMGRDVAHVIGITFMLNNLRLLFYSLL